MSELLKAEGSGIFIECPPAEFGKFLFELLKSPRITSNTIPMVFEINRQNIFDLVSMVMQRVEEQHECSLIETSAGIQFTDDREIQIFNLNDFEDYADIGSQLAKRISLRITYLIKTPKDSVPHKQVVSFGFSLHRTHSNIYRRNANIISLLEYGPGYSYYNVEHTLISFGEDISSLLERKLRSFSLIDLKMRFWNRWYARVLVSSIATFVCIGVALLIGKGVGDAFLPVRFAESSDSVAALQALGIYLTLLAGVICITIIGTIALYDWFSEIRPSFIKLSESAELDAKRLLKRHEKRSIIFIAAAVGSLLIGVSSSLVASGLWKRLLE